ncbi:fumarylacetoacetate hydrolase family protein [Virgibacillus doumboii]|uniref:fumarylacetoacetate hydrolase family protein n=1 Tax=Virgibacillus doumboii TaxID=2697503 RepID=UPI0013DFD58A|nr:fumarylacetoacetate hydrolase family protein [Virgibacillus doumboii]
MKIIRFLDENHTLQLAAVNNEDQVYVLPFKHFTDVIHTANLKNSTPVHLIQEVIYQSLPLESALKDLTLLTPIDAPEVWAAGVTYEKSRDERNYEATGGKLNASTFYDKVYNAERPELFMKSTRDRTVGPDQDVYLRGDSNWQIPEPELGLVLDYQGDILGYTIGNDMSCRDIEGDNPLYLPQAKIWKSSCSIGPSIRLVETVEDPYKLQITCRIFRNEEKVFESSASTSQLKRKLTELTSYLVRDNIVFDGTVLLTGSCIVPPHNFTLTDGDRIEIEIPEIGILNNLAKAQIKESNY